MPPAEIQALTRNARILLAAAARLGVPAIVTEQYPKGLGRTLPAVAEAIPPDATRAEKTCFSAAPAQRSGRPQTVIAGMETHVCVLQTALDLLAQGGEVFVVEDACCSRNPANRANALARMRAAGAIVTNTESVVFEWLRNAAHPEFKAISALVR